MALSKQKKHSLRAEFAQGFADSSSAVLAGYSGLTMSALSELRNELRKSQTKFRIVKNNLVKKAFEIDDAKRVAFVQDEISGPVAVAFVEGDPAQAAKTLFDFQKVHPALVIKGGYVEDKVVSVEELKQIASLPSREELLAKIVGTLVAPHRGILGILTGVPRQLVQVINAIKDKKS
jgi:large subunit ribosomal protein L10